MQAPVTETLREKLTRVNNELRAAGRPDSFYLSLEGSWNRYGSLTERQEAALIRSFAQREERAAARAQEAAPTQPMPTGRVVISGEILTTKWQDSRFGGSLKMLLKSEAGWKVWGTVPASISGNDALKGRRVTFTATVEPKEAAFGFFSRPTNARLLPEAAQAEAPAAAPVAAPAPAGKLSDIIAKAKEREDMARMRQEDEIKRRVVTGDWDTDSMTDAERDREAYEDRRFEQMAYGDRD